MLQIKNLTITHRKDLRIIVEDFSCTLRAGDKAVIIGEEGNGKSTLLRWIYDEGLIGEYAEAQGERIMSGERLAFLPQELWEADRQKTVYEFFAEEERFFDRNPKELNRLAAKLHVSADFFYRKQKMGTLSGGEKIKAQMMRLLLAEPTALLLDEPSNDIDLETLEWLEELIRDWKGIMLFISHDETLIENAANMVIHMEQLRRKSCPRYTVAHMSFAQYKKDRDASFENQRRQAQNDRREKKIRDEKMRRIEQSVSYRLDNISKAERDGPGRLLKKKMKAVKSMERRFEREDAEMAQMPEEEGAIYFELGEGDAAIPAGKTVLEYAADALYTPDGERVLARNLFLRVRGPEKICITGKNGAGKTTLLRSLAGQLLSRTDICVGYMPQNYEELLDLDMPPVEYLDTSGEKVERTKIRTFLGALKFTADEMNRPVAELSGGQKAKILLLKMSLEHVNVLILDEPTRNFSPLSGGVIRRMLAEFPGAIISISHDRKYLEEVCDTIYELTAEGFIRREAGRNLYEKAVQEGERG